MRLEVVTTRSQGVLCVILDLELLNLLVVTTEHIK